MVFREKIRISRSHLRWGPALRPMRIGLCPLLVMGLVGPAVSPAREHPEHQARSSQSPAGGSTLARPPLGVSAGGAFLLKTPLPGRARYEFIPSRGSRARVQKLVWKPQGVGIVRVQVSRHARPGRYRLRVCVAGRCRRSARAITITPQRGKPNPLNVTPKLDGARAVEATIGPAGGELAATGGDGSKFRLAVAPGALPIPTTIRMTPVAAVALPSGARLAAGVRLEPEGQTFQAPVDLTVQPARPVPLNRQFPVLWSGEGRDVHQHPIRPDRHRVVFPLTHFSTPALLDATQLRWPWSPSSRQAWALQEVAKQTAEARRTGKLAGRAESAAYIAMYVMGNEVIRGELQAVLAGADPSDAAIDAALAHFAGFHHLLELLAIRDATLVALRDELAKLAEAIVLRARTLAFERCQRGDLTQAARLVALQRVALLTDAPNSADAIEKLDKCLRFELRFDSDVTYGYRARVLASIPLQGSMRQTTSPDGRPAVALELVGTGPVTYPTWSGRLESTGGDCPGYSEAVSAPVGTPLLRVAVRDLDVTRRALEPFTSPSVELDFDPLYELVHTHSCDLDETNAVTFWTERFGFLHHSGPGDQAPLRYSFTGFAPGQMFLVARKEFRTDLPAYTTTENGNVGATDMHETTYIDLLHRPVR